MSALKATIIILGCWVILLVVIYFTAIWPGYQCDLNDDRDKYNTSDLDFATNLENEAWYQKYPEFYSQRNLSTLKLLHVIARHGDRTNVRVCEYPNDPYRNETYEPVGWGEMTNLGKRRMYEVGRSLRQQYDKFLGSYDVKHLDAISSELGRSRNSLELMLTGIFPPKDEFIWMKGLNWQPIAFHSNTGKDNLLGNPIHNCDHWARYYNESHANFQDVMTNYSDYFDRLVDFTGWDRDLLSVNLIYNSITTNLAWGHELHESLKQFWPEPTLTLNNIFWDAFSRTEDTKRAGAGLIFQKIVDNIKRKVLQESQVKLHLYSGSDFNILLLLRVLGQEIFENAPFGSHLIIEMHESDENKEIYLKFFYRPNLDGPLQELVIPDCQTRSNEGELICLFDQLLLTRQKYFLPQNFC